MGTSKHKGTPNLFGRNTRRNIKLIQLTKGLLLPTCLILLHILLPFVDGMVEVPNDEEWVSCGEFKETAALAQCLCYVSEDEGFKVNCDHVVFSTDFPLLPFRQPITYFSQRFVNYQTLPPQAFLASGVPLQTLDLSNNWLRRLTEKSLEGLTESLEILDLSHNRFGDQLNPIFSTTEFKRLPRLRALTLGNNMLSHLDGGIIDNALSLEEFYLGLSLRRLSYEYRVGVSTASKIIQETLLALKEYLCPLYLKMPESENEWCGIAEQFQSEWQFPNCIGAIDGKHIHLFPPRNSGSLYYNYKQGFSVVLLAIVDADYKFIGVSIGANGKCSDSGIWGSSNLRTSILTNSANLSAKPLPNSSQILGHVILGDSGFPLEHFLMRPYGETNLTPKQRIFNYRLSRARRVSENAFGILANRWRILLSRMLLSPEKGTLITIVCCALHNMMCSRKQWRDQYIPDGFVDSEDIEGRVMPDHNELKGVPSKSLKGPNALKILDLSHNQIDELRGDDFAQAVSLLMLNMSRNEIGVIQGGAFRGMSSLKVVDLSWNRLLRLSSDSFMGLASIEEIDLSNNFLNQIPITSLKILPTLKVLRMGSNLLQNLEGTTLKQLPNLEMLDLSRNRLSEIPKGFFGGLTRIREVNLGVNQLRTLPATIFEDLKNLEKLNLMDNNLLTFPSAALENLFALNTLILDYNRISALQPSQPSNLTELSIAHNLIREIPPETFKSFPNMTYLNLQGNQVESVEELTLPLSLLELNLGSNQLRTIPRFQLPNLEILNLKGNQVGALLQHNFVLLGNIRELNLGNNMIASFFSNSFDGLDALLDLDLSGNKLQFLPKFGNLLDLEILNFSRNHLKEIGSIENMENLKLLDLSSNQLTNLNAEIFQNTSNIITLDLKDNKLTSFRGFSRKFERLKTLDLSRNQISYVYPNSFESFGNLWNLNMNQNRFSLFPTEFLKPCKQLRYIGLSKNHLKNLNEMNFSNFPFLRELDLSNNAIESVIPHAFLNSTQLQRINLSGNKLENLDANIWKGLLRLELDLSDNYLSTLPPTLFDRGHVQKLQEIRLSRNSFTSIPSDSLQKQYFYLEQLDMAENKISTVAPNLNILVNVKSLDLSFNPLDEPSLKNILNEPKTVRVLNLANCSIKALPMLEMPFLRELNLSRNGLSSFGDTVFQRSTLLEKMDLSHNQFFNLEYTLPPSLKVLDLSSNPLTLISGGNFPQSLQVLRLNSLPSLLKVEKSALVIKNLVELELYNLPKLGYLDIRGILSNLHFLQAFDFEVKDTQLVDQLHPGLTARVNRIGLRGRRVRSISTGAFAGLTSPSVAISLVNTSLSLLPSILVPVPMSSQISLDVTGSKITNLSPPFLSQNIQLKGLTPTCDCNAVNLVRYLQATEANVFCGAPRKLEGTSVLSLTPDDLTCDSGSSTTPPPEPSSISTTTTTSTTPTPSTTDDVIIWSVAPSTKSASNKSGKNSSKSNRKVVDASSNKSKPEVNNMDSLIFGIVGGVIVLIVLFVIIIVCFVKLSNSSSSTDGIYPPAAPSVISMGPHQSIYGPVGTLGSKCTCSGGGGNKGHPHHIHPHGGYMMTSAGPYGTVRSNVGKIYGGGGGIYAMQQGQGPASLHSLSGMPMSMSMGPQSLSPYVNANYANSMGPASLRHHHQQQQQQMQYNSMQGGYYGQDSDYESRR